MSKIIPSQLTRCAFVMIGFMTMPFSWADERIDELARQLESTQLSLDQATMKLAELSGTVSHEFEPNTHSPDYRTGSSDDSVSTNLASYFRFTNSPGCPPSVAAKPFQVSVFGAIYAEMIASENTVSLRGAPLFLAPGPAAGIDDSRFTVSGQQSLIGLNVAGPNLGSFESGANVAVNFFGEQPIANNPGLFFLIAWSELKNEQWRFWIGQDADGIGRQNSNSPSWTSHKQHGNIGQLRPGFRMERYFSCGDSLEASLYFGLTQQAVNDFIAVPDVSGIDNGWPNVELRWETAIGPKVASQRAILFAVGGLIGETRAVEDLGSAANVSTSWAIIPELRLESERFGFQGELFIGEAFGTYNGAIGQSLNPQDGESIYSAGGFGELFCKLTPDFTVSIGYGIDDPRDSDLGLVTPTVGQRSRNESYWINSIWKISDEWETRFEVSQLETDYVAPSNSDKAMIYHFLLRYAF